MSIITDRLPAFVDTHIHLFDLSHPSLRWDWIDTPDDHYELGNIDQIKMRAFTMRALEAEARFSGVTSFVHVQAAIGSPDPVEETRWLEAMAVEHPRLAAIVGHVTLADRDAGDVMDAHLAASTRFRGVRDFAVEPWLASGRNDPAMERGLALLTERGLLLDLDCAYPNMSAARRMAGRYPELPVVLEHIGFPRRRDKEYFDNWSAGIRELAQADNVTCKMSGIAMTDPQFTLDSLRPWAETCLQVFGPERCMIGSNWPLDRLFSSYDSIIAVYRELLGSLDREEQEQVLITTAERVYRPER
ncbi:amidohydrolase family protein [Tessaracoccus sp. MC1865]|uniref:amidohydrolase family protein n=1 Tax=Tessaracoccus sp. MC1865 TaxID=2760310 RepID=UPI001601DA31|nr:amidohydrolase family protein [Tessaracoccus sp. MC1865]MBB1482912.1 amidohydrolase family protein [Tessaracoccus sp. MC1865]QTO37649.1 amidohydrolase family protein [Tessaracoccus sp. MC1865]